MKTQSPNASETRAITVNLNKQAAAAERILEVLRGGICDDCKKRGKMGGGELSFGEKASE